MADIFDEINESPAEGDGQGETTAEETPLDGQGESGGEGAPGTDDGQGQGDAANTSTGWQEEFKTPEEMYTAYQGTKKSYDNLRPKLTETTQKLSQMMKQTAPAPRESAPNASYEDRLVTTVQNILVPMQQQQAQLMMQNEVSRLATEHEDFNEVAPDMMAVLDDNPELWNTKTPLDLAYQIARTKHMSAAVQQVAKDARASAYKDREIKEVKNFQTAKGSQMAGNMNKTPEQEVLESIRGTVRSSNYFI